MFHLSCLFSSFIAISNVKKQDILINEKDDVLIKEEFKKDKNVFSNFLIIKSENNDLSILKIYLLTNTILEKVIKDLRFNLFGEGILSDKKIYNQLFQMGIFIHIYLEE